MDMSLVLIVTSIAMAYVIFGKEIKKIKRYVATEDMMKSMRLRYKVEVLIQRMDMPTSERLVDAALEAVIQSAREEFRLNRAFDILDYNWLEPVVESAIIKANGGEVEEKEKPVPPEIEQRAEGDVS